MGASTKTPEISRGHVPASISGCQCIQRKPKRKPSTKTKTLKRKPFSLLVLVARSGSQPRASLRLALRLQSFSCVVWRSSLRSRGLRIVVRSTLPRQNLIVYQVARELVVIIREAKIAAAKLRDQALRAATSACLNIAEAVGHVHENDKRERATRTVFV
jgi:hypothetical protein